MIWIFASSLFVQFTGFQRRWHKRTFCLRFTVSPWHWSLRNACFVFSAFSSGSSVVKNSRLHLIRKAFSCCATLKDKVRELKEDYLHNFLSRSSSETFFLVSQIGDFNIKTAWLWLCRIILQVIVSFESWWGLCRTISRTNIRFCY